MANLLKIQVVAPIIRIVAVQKVPVCSLSEYTRIKQNKPVLATLLLLLPASFRKMELTNDILGSTESAGFLILLLPCCLLSLSGT